MDIAGQESDETLLRRIGRGDEAAFALLVRRHSDKFYALAWRMLADRGDAEDVVQEAFLKLWQNPALYNADKGVRFTTWFYRVVTNLAIDRSRKRGRTVYSERLELFESAQTSPEQNAANVQKEKALEAAIQDLPEKQRAALNLCFYEELSNKDAAAILGIGVKALESLLMRAKAGLRKALESNGMIESRPQPERGQGGDYDERKKRKSA